ncbi:hypothetical protein N2152v2_002766 [Parachlorella kessleri]
MSEALEPFQKDGISREAIEESLKAARRRRTDGVYKVLLYNSSIYVDTSQPGDGYEGFRSSGAFLTLVNLLCKQRGLPNVEFVYNMHDQPCMPRDGPLLPVLGWSTSALHLDIPVPYHWSWVHIPPNSSSVRVSFNATEWEGRASRAVWRGSTTGCPNPSDGWCMNTLENWNTTARVRLVQMCKRRPDLCDAAFTGLAQAGAAVEAAMRHELRFVRSSKSEDLIKQYKYLLVPRGNGPPSSRSLQALRAPAVPLWQQTEEAEFFYPALRPYVHYIPLARGLEDLYSAIEWAQQHPAACMRIIRAGQAWARRYIHSEFANSYLHALLVEYARLQRFQPTVTAGYQRLKVDAGQVATVEKTTGGCRAGWTVGVDTG